MRVFLGFRPETFVEDGTWQHTYVYICYGLDGQHHCWRMSRTVLHQLAHNAAMQLPTQPQSLMLEMTTLMMLQMLLNESYEA